MKMLAALFLLPFLIGVTVCEDDQTMALHFLNQYGYISSSRSGNHDVPTAIRSFQEYFGLPVSGKLDDSTIRLMRKPRCGMSDPTGEDRVRRYATLGKWRKTNLTYYIKPGDDLPHDQQRKIFAHALQFWADVSGLSFSEAGSASEADIKISFGRHSHNGTNGEGICPYPFSGPGGVLAHAFYPQVGRAHFDEDETYTHGTSRGTNLLWVAVHEFGHSLGLRHTNIEGAIMYPYYTGYVPNLKLHSDDIAGIQSLYGENIGGGGGGGGSNGGGGSSGVVVQTPAPTAAPTNSGNCLDRLTLSSRSCDPYKKAGYCEKHPGNMKYWCAKTCFNCNV